LPSWTSLIHDQKAWSATLPRESTMSSNFTAPGSFFMMGWPSSLLARCSMTPTEMDSPLTCLNCAIVMESISTW